MNVRGFLLLTQRFLLAPMRQQALVEDRQDFRADVLRHGQPLHHGSQARLRTFPDGLGDRGDNLLWFEVGQEEGRVQIALYWPAPT